MAATRKPRIGEGVSRTLTTAGWGQGHVYMQEEMAEADFVKYGQGMIPRLFQANYIEHDPQDPDDALLVVQLLYAVDESEGIQLRQAISWPVEVPEALAILRSMRSMDQWKRLALMSLFADQAEATVRLEEKVTGETVPQQNRADIVGEAIRSAAGTPVARRRNRITMSHLEDVADVYRAAWRAGDPPTEAVKAHFQTSHSTAARWVGMARKAKLLGDPAGARGGEASTQEEADQ